MYNEATKKATKKYIEKNRSMYNDYQNRKQREYYKSNPEVKLRKQRDYKWKQITIVFRNILIPSL
jgi:hypothetical protein